ncbi:hypothetical protein CVT24_007804 [Panaeolus cyanescens]|uniref:Nephrocystin 3-like N-terminal domain-containing protein n=1 Tax=Panaeolus cyanescens TaxID=181874 RepID=A0A409W4M7_9AGAR|nr:hypothetical protein CVT24_007804 [Panaeolus cyanescens]
MLNVGVTTLSPSTLIWGLVSIHSSPSYTNPEFSRLFEHISGNALHDADEYEEVRCHPETRITILKLLRDWGTEVTDTTKPILWLHGPAGAGKTAIARSFAQSCQASSLLIGGFFFWRTDRARSDEKRLIPTLAYQLALSIPLVRPFIEERIAYDPAIFTKSLSSQLDALIISPIRSFREHHPHINPSTLPRIIIVDALDECGGLVENPVRSQERALEVLHQLSDHQALFPFRVLVVSRKESPLVWRFQQEELASKTHQVALDGTFQPDKDIELYVEREFLEIKTNHPLKQSLPENWPEANAIKRIVAKSSGQFIYAATVMRFLRSGRHRPDKQLLIIEGLKEPTTFNSPYERLDALYNQILDCGGEHEVSLALDAIAIYMVHGWPNEWRRDDVHLLEAGDYAQQSTYFESLLSLDPGSLQNALSPFESILAFENTRLVFHHASFPDFLRDKARAGKRHIDLSLRAEVYAIKHLEMMDKATSEAQYALCIICIMSSLTLANPSPRLKDAILSGWFGLMSLSAAQTVFPRCSWLKPGLFCTLFQAGVALSRFPGDEKMAIRNKLAERLKDAVARYITEATFLPIPSDNFITFNLLTSERGFLARKRYSTPLIYSRNIRGLQGANQLLQQHLSQLSFMLYLGRKARVQGWRSPLTLLHDLERINNPEYAWIFSLLALGNLGEADSSAGPLQRKTAILESAASLLQIVLELYEGDKHRAEEVLGIVGRYIIFRAVRFKAIFEEESNENSDPNHIQSVTKLYRIIAKLTEARDIFALDLILYENVFKKSLNSVLADAKDGVEKAKPWNQLDGVEGKQHQAQPTGEDHMSSSMSHTTSRLSSLKKPADRQAPNPVSIVPGLIGPWTFISVQINWFLGRLGC